jgi:hypothetical protein
MPGARNPESYPQLKGGGPRCPDCKLAAPMRGQSHVCLGGRLVKGA